METERRVEVDVLLQFNEYLYANFWIFFKRMKVGVLIGVLGLIGALYVLVTGPSVGPVTST